MQRLASMVPAQSAVERKNGLIWLTGGNRCRNNLSLGSRCELALVADKYRQQRIKKARQPSCHLQVDDDDDDDDPDHGEDLVFGEGAELGVSLVDDMDDWASVSSGSDSDESLSEA